MSTVSLIDGVGGAFVFSEDPKRLADWYTEHLGIEFEGGEEFGAFYVRYVAADPSDADWIMDTTFAIMKAKQPVPRMTPNEGTRAGGHVRRSTVHGQPAGARPGRGAGAPRRSGVWSRCAGTTRATRCSPGSGTSRGTGSSCISQDRKPAAAAAAEA